MRIIEIQIGKKNLELVAGLVWHPLQALGSARAKEILDYAQAHGADLKVLRGDESPHVGLTKKLDGGKPGQVSISAVIADALAAKGHRNILVAIAFPDDRDTYIFVCVRDGVILADGDAVGTRDEIRVRLVGDVAYGGWDAVICPGEWGVLNAEERDFDSFFRLEVFESTKQWQLKETTIAWRKSLIPVVVLIVLATGTIYGWNFWQKKKAAEAEVLRLQQEEVARGQKTALTEPPKPWPLMPNTQVFTQACFQAFQQVGISAGNWSLDGASCEAGFLTVRWLKSNDSAWISHLKAIRPNAVIASDGQSAWVTVAAFAAPSNDFSTALPAVPDLSLRYLDLASRYGMSVRIDQPQAPPVPAALPGQAVNPALVTPPSWLAMPLQVNANFHPNEVATLLSYPGLRFTKLVFAYKAGAIQYQFTGIQYVRS
jgi:Pilin accessory protein (PilO)